MPLWPDLDPVTGGTLTSDDLDLYANDEAVAWANTGRIKAHERFVFDEDITLTSSAFDCLIDYGYMNARTVTIGAGLAGGLAGFLFSPTINYSTSQLFTQAPTFRAGPIWQPTATVGDLATAYAGFEAAMSWKPNAGSGTFATPFMGGFVAAGITQRMNAGTVTLAEWNSFYSSMAGNIKANTTCTDYVHFKARSPTKGGTITTETGLDLHEIVEGTTCLSIRSRSSGAEMRHAGDVMIGADSSPATTLEVQASNDPLVTLDQNDSSSHFINFEGGAGAGATNPIHTGNNSGATTEHIRIQVNGSTRWIAVSTATPT